MPCCGRGSRRFGPVDRSCGPADRPKKSMPLTSSGRVLNATRQLGAPDAPIAVGYRRRPDMLEHRLPSLCQTFNPNRRLYAVGRAHRGGLTSMRKIIGPALIVLTLAGCAVGGDLPGDSAWSRDYFKVAGKQTPVSSSPIRPSLDSRVHRRQGRARPCWSAHRRQQIGARSGPEDRILSDPGTGAKDRRT